MYFYLLRRALPDVQFDWTVIETEEMAQAHLAFEEPHLRWRSLLPETPGADKAFDLCLVSSSLLYVPEPYNRLEKLINLGRFILVTRTAFIEGPEDKIAVQRIPPEMFTGSYPAWFFSESKFLNFLQKKARINLVWDVPQDIFQFEGKRIVCKGYLIENNDA